MSDSTGFGTRAVRIGQDPQQWSSYAVIPPINVATTYLQAKPGVKQDYDYSRDGNPTRTCLEKALASLEESEYALTFSSGMAGIAAVISLLKPGDKILCGDEVYGGTDHYLRGYCADHSIQLDFVDPDSDEFMTALHESPNMVWVESLSNPSLKVADIKEISKMIQNRSDTLFVVDNTFFTPYFLKPLQLGADIVVHSATKYINGHSDVTMGVVGTNEKTLYNKLRSHQRFAGAVPSPIDSFLVNRGLKTLHVRMDQHMKNGLILAEYLESHPMVKKVYYPGLKGHPHHERYLKQATGISGMISFNLDMNEDEVELFVRNFKVILLATSLGGVESLIQVYHLMSFSLSEEGEELESGPKVDKTFVRFSVGLESAQDLIEDLNNAFNAVRMQREDTKDGQLH